MVEQYEDLPEDLRKALDEVMLDLPDTYQDAFKKGCITIYNIGYEEGRAQLN